MGKRKNSVKRVREVADYLERELGVLGYAMRREYSTASNGSVYLFALFEGATTKIRVSNHGAPRFSWPHTPPDFDVAVGRVGTPWWDIGAEMARRLGAGPTPAMIRAAHDSKRSPMSKSNVVGAGASRLEERSR